jgi:hypothetical protein
MNRKFLIRLAPLLAIAAFAVVPAAAQGAKYFKAGSEIPLGEHVPTLAWGTLTLTPEPPVAKPTVCENVVGAYVTNSATIGEGATLNFATYNCANVECPAGKVKIGEGEFEKEFAVVATQLPWPSTLIEEEGIRVDSTNVKVSLGCIAHSLSNTSPPGKTTAGEPGAQESFYLAAPTTCITNGPEFVQRPLAVNGKNTTVTSKLEFDAKAGSLSCAGGAVKGKTAGKLKVAAYKESEVIASK